MAKRADVELRIRSKNLASKELRDVNDELNKLVGTQKKQADSAEATAKSLRQLNEEQRDLAKISAELSRRRGMIESLVGKQSEISAASSNIKRIRQELDNLLTTKRSGQFLGDIDKAIKNTQTELANATKAFNRTVSGADKLQSQLKGLGVGTDDLSASLRQVDTMLDRANVGMADQASAVSRYAQAQNEAAIATRKAAEAQRFQNDLISRRRADAVAGFAGLDQFNAQRKAAQQEAAATERVRGINERFAAVMDRRSLAQDRAARSADRDRQSLDGVSRSAGGAASSTDRYAQALRRGSAAGNVFADTGRKSLSVYQRLRGEILSLAAAYVGVYQAVNLLNQAVQTDQRRQNIATQINIANEGNAQRNAADLKFLREEADRLGLTFEDLAKNFANYKIAARAAGATNKQVKTSFTQASEIVTGLRLSAEDADGVFRAFVQIMSKARVQAEELRGQLGDRLPGAVAAFAKANNIALSDLDEHLQKGRGNVQEFLAFLGAYSQKVNAAVNANSKTLQADINRLKNTFGDFLQQLAQSGTSSELQKTIQKLNESLSGDQGARFAKQLGDAFAAVLKVMQFVIENFDTFLSLMKAFIALQAAKAVYGVALSFVEMSKGVAATMKWLVGMPAALRAAAAGGSAFAAATLRIGTLLLGPVGIALAGLAAVYYGIARAERAAAEESDRFTESLQRSRQTQGEQIRGSVKNLQAETTAMNKELKELIARRDEMEKRKAGRGGVEHNALAKVTDVFRDPENVENIDNINERIKLLKVRLDGTATAAQNASRRYVEFRKAQSQLAAEDNAEKPNFQLPTGEDEKVKKTADLAEKRRDIADRAAKELLDIEKSLQDAMLEADVTTDAQIKANLDARLKIIDAEIKKKRVELEALKHDAERVGATDAARSATTALGMLDSLRQIQEEKAKEKAITDQVALAEKKINDLIAERDAKIAAVRTEQEVGLKTEVEARREALAIQQQYAGAIKDNITQLIMLLQSLPPDVFARLGGAKLVAELEAARLKAVAVKTELQQIGENLGGQFAAGAAQAFGELAKGLAGFLQGANSLSDAFKGAMQSFRQFLADFLVGIGQAIIQAIILKAIMNAINGASGGYGAAISGVLGASNHTGGIVGQDGKSRWIPATALANAQRFHDGGMPGLKSNEVPTILEKGEEVLTADNPRHQNNWGGQGGGNTTIINSIDSPSVVEQGLPTKAGTRVLLNTVKANKQAIRSALGIA